MMEIRTVIFTMLWSHIVWITVHTVNIPSLGKTCKIFIPNGSQKTEQSIIQGGVQQLTPDDEHCAFLRIPYAMPPIDNLRFEAPQLWPLEDSATHFNRSFIDEANWCLQSVVLYANRVLVGSEDCLYLNIFTSKRINHRIFHRNKKDDWNSTSTKLLHPILVWIHGGSFNYGSASAWSDRFSYFIKKDIVVVTINYRLGPLGFMAVPEANISPNNGLRDQQMALQWIQRYAKYFGGNPNDVTLMGWSAGAASVSYHLYIESSRNLFHRAILMSGTMMSQWAFDANPNYCAAFKVDSVRKEINNREPFSLRQLLQETDRNDLFPTYKDSISKVVFGIPQDCFVPAIDGQLIVKRPYELIKQKPALDVPLLIGDVKTELSVDDEASSYSFQCENVHYPNDNTTLLTQISNYLETNCSFFREDHSLNETQIEFYLQFLSEIEMHHGFNKFVQAYNQFTTSAIYVYQYSAGESINLKHGDDVQHILPIWPNDVSTKRPAIGHKMQRMWKNFIKKGYPTIKQINLHMTTWQPFDKEKSNYLNIDHMMTMKQRNDTASPIKLWEDIYKCLYNFDCDTVYGYLNGSNKCTQ